MEYLFHYHKKILNYLALTSILYKRSTRYGVIGITFLLSILIYIPVQAQTIKTTELTIAGQDLPLIEVFREIEKRTDFQFSYNETDIKGLKVNLVNERMSVEKILTLALQNTPLVFKVIDNKIAVYEDKEKRSGSPESVNKQEEMMVEGIVNDTLNRPLSGVSITLQSNPKKVVSTDENGLFRISVPSTGTLIAKSIGYKTTEVPIAGNQRITISLLEDMAGLDEVVVVGYGTQKKINLTGAVDKVEAEQLERYKLTSMGEALQSQVPNLNVNISDGKPGRGASFNIRGTTSINGGSPLILLDNVPISSFEFNNISPQDIDNISFLKDASSAAIYGARAAYGVILVQSKQGIAGKTEISYNNNFKWGKATRVPKVYTGLDYTKIQEEEFNGNIGQTYFTEPQVEYPFLVNADPTLPLYDLQNIGGKATLLLGGPVINYYEEWFREYSPEQNHHLSVRGGTNKFKYYVSGDYNYEEGNLKFKPEKINRYNLRSNTTYQFSDKVSVFTKSSATLRRDDIPNTYLYGFSSNPWRFIDNTNPLLPEYIDINGEKIPTDIGFYKEFIQNQSEYKTNTSSFLNQIGTDISLLNKSLTLHADASYMYYHWYRNRWWDNTGPYLSHSFNNRNIVLSHYADAGPSKIYKSNTEAETFNVNAYANYKKAIGLHEIDLTGGMTFERYSEHYETVERQNPILGIDEHSLNLATGIFNASDTDDGYANRSIFLRGNYQFNNRYLLEVNGMHNYTSKFRKDMRGAYFGSFSMGWRVSEEGFFESLKPFVNEFKLRGSFGSLGNQNIGSFDYLSILSLSQSTYMLNGERYAYTSSPAPISQNFTWETSKTIDLGADIQLLNSKLAVVFDYYQRNTDNMLAPIYSLPSVFGAAVPKENIASLRNRGWELTLSWKDKIGSAKPFFYDIRFNLSDYKAVITDYYNPTNYLGDYYVGQEIGEIWGLNTLGLFQSDEEAKNSPLLQTSSYRQFVGAGNIKFEDSNNDGVINRGDWTLANHGDYRIIGNTTPRYLYGINLNFAYQGFDLSAFFNGVGKRDIYPTAETANFWSSYNRKYQVLLEHVVENRWTPENPNAYFPKPQGYVALGNNDLGVPQTRYLQDASYLRLKNLIIGYSFPTHLFKNSIKYLRLYLAGTNLFELTNLHETLDPEGLQKDPDANEASVGLGTAYPIQRTYSFGLELKF
ncbi:SusC/RagA family TonB-linked outer membrane protein [Olivibacter jilunii]|uniref:SusC/RagA family TonB-linked outer membrane protein n=1 Tax=Olivibacter jilunii TaxID=985016 RepID=UPI001031AC80|nr:SusC/RagA family TonB-linked outer membrane protein [Olivibacter jilunii]